MCARSAFGGTKYYCCRRIISTTLAATAGFDDVHAGSVPSMCFPQERQPACQPRLLPSAQEKARRAPTSSPSPPQHRLPTPPHHHPGHHGTSPAVCRPTEAPILERRGKISVSLILIRADDPRPFPSQAGHTAPRAPRGLRARSPRCWRPAGVGTSRVGWAIDPLPMGATRRSGEPRVAEERFG